MLSLDRVVPALSHADEYADYLADAPDDDVARRAQRRVDEARAALNRLAGASRRAADVVEAVLALVLTDVIHSIRRIWGTFADYQLHAHGEIVTGHLLMALRGTDRRFIAHLPSAALRAKNRMATRHVVAICRRPVEKMIPAEGIALTLCPEIYLPFYQGLGHAHVKEPLSVRTRVAEASERLARRRRTRRSRP